MSENKRKYGISLLVLGTLVILYYGVWGAFQNPELTQTQLFLQDWLGFSFGIILSIIGYKMMSDNE